MASFLFSPANSEDLSTGTYYIHLVTSTPNTTATTVVDINTSDAINYQPKLLTGLTYNQTKWTFSDTSFPTYTYNTIVTGVVIAKRLSNNFYPSDPILYYADIQNVLFQPVSLTTGKYTISIKFPIDGVIAFSQYYQYSGGAYINNEVVPKGLMYLLGTRNNTQSFVSPLNNSILTNNTNVDLFNRSIDFLNTEGITPICYEFGSRRIRLSTIGLFHRGDAGDLSPTTTYTVYGSNTVPDLTTLNINNPIFWTLIGTSNNMVAGWNFINCTNTTFWKTLKFVSSNRKLLQEIEFYNSTMYSTDENLMSTVIDAPFSVDLLDKTGFGHTFTNNNNNLGIINNSLYVDGVSTISLSASALFNLKNRNYKLSIEFKSGVVSGTQSGGILTWRDTAGLPLALTISNTNTYNLIVGTTSTSLHTVSSTISPSTTVFNNITTSRILNSFTTIINNDTTNPYNDNITGVVGDATNIKLGANGFANIKGFIRNFKLIT